MLIAFDFFQLGVQTNIRCSALPATCNILCICLRCSFEHRVSYISAENTLFNPHLQLKGWVLEMSMALHSDSNLACLLEQTQQQDVIIRHLIRRNAFMVVWGKLLLEQHAVNMTGQVQVRIMKSILQF